MVIGLPSKNIKTSLPIVYVLGIPPLRVEISFFWVVSSIVPFEISKRISKGALGELCLIDPSFNSSHYDSLRSNLTHILAFHEEVLVLAGLSGVWDTSDTLHAIRKLGNGL